MTFDPAGVPLALTSRPRWVCADWRFDGMRWTKVPLRALAAGRAHASVTDPATWASFPEAVERAFRAGWGIGFVLAAEEGEADEDRLAAWDFDHAVEGGVVAPVPLAQAARLDSYPRFSVSGTGLHVFALGTLPAAGRRRGPVEAYSDKRYVVVTGRRVPGVGTPQVESRQAEMAALWGELFGPADAGASPPRDRPGPVVEDSELVRRAQGLAARFRRLWDGDVSDYASPSEADLGFLSYLVLAGASDPAQLDRVYRASRLMRPKWGRRGYREATIAKALSVEPLDWRAAEPIIAVSSERLNGHRHHDPGGRGDDEAGGAPPVNPPGDPPPDAGEVPEHVVAGVRLTDIGNGQRLACRVRDRMVWVPERRAWLRHDGRRWVSAVAGEEVAEAKQSVLDLYMIAPRLPPAGRDALVKHARASEAHRRLGAAVDLARAEPGITVGEERFDADPWLLNTVSGTVDLRTDGLRPHRAADLLSMTTNAPFDPTATAPRWEAFLAEVLPDPEVREFLQTYFGASLTGHPSEQVVAILCGRGANGKSVLAELLLEVLGDYGGRAPVELLVEAQRPTGGPTPELARLRGRRVVFASESAAGHRLNAARLKEIAGGERVVARRLYSDPVEFEPSFSVTLVTNFRPAAAGDDPALWRRLRLVTFPVEIPEERRDNALRRKLFAERAGILNWLLAGWRRYRELGHIPTPDAVRLDTDRYRADNDEVGRWLGECCVLEAAASESASGLFDHYLGWLRALEPDAEPLKRRAFGVSLRQRGLDNHRERRGWVWRGVRLRRFGEPPPADHDAGEAG